MIPQNFIDDLLNRTDIVEVVGQHVQLKNAGSNFQGLCPFHREKTPSFSVSATKQFYHCFGCGAHGNALSFVMNHLGLDFPQAVESLAGRIGLEVPNQSNDLIVTEEKDKRSTHIEYMWQAANFYKHNLKQTPQVIDYLKGRGVSGKTASKFHLGFALNQYQGLANVFSFYQSNGQVLDDVGLTKCNDQGKRYDRFRNRIMFPIRNVKGDLVGFGGRVFDQTEPKYLNSPESTLFSKGDEVYGLFEAQKAIRDRGFVLVTEGYMDVLSLVQGGFENSVATLGTAVSGTHVQKLKKYSKRVFFAFDGDKAGQQAAWRALEAFLPFANESFSALFLVLPAGHDPDSLIRLSGSAGMQQLISQALPLSEFLIEKLRKEFVLSSVEQRAAAVAFLRPLLQKLPDSAYQLGLMQQLAQVLGYSLLQLQSLFSQGLESKHESSMSLSHSKKVSSKFHLNNGATGRFIQLNRKSPLFNLAVRLVRIPHAYLQCMPVVQLIAEHPHADQESAFFIRLFEQLKNEVFNPNVTVAKKTTDEYQLWLSSVLSESDQLGVNIDLEAELNDCVYVCCEHWFKSELNRLSQIQVLNEQERQWYQMCLQQFQKLKQNRVNQL